MKINEWKYIELENEVLVAKEYTFEKTGNYYFLDKDGEEFIFDYKSPHIDGNYGFVIRAKEYQDLLKYIQENDFGIQMIMRESVKHGKLTIKEKVV